MGERWIQRIRRRRQAGGGVPAAHSAPGVATQAVPWERSAPWDGTGPSWTRSTWRTCGLCGRRVMCLVDGRAGVVGWVCTTCDR
jgi:hypothetical protein